MCYRTVRQREISQIDPPRAGIQRFRTIRISICCSNLTAAAACGVAEQYDLCTYPIAMTNYKKSYSILGVFQDDDWETVRNAYKRQIRRWHPDRFQDADQRKIAEDRCKEINLAYQALDNYYRQAGALPPEWPVTHETPAPAGEPRSEQTTPPAPESVTIDLFQDTHTGTRGHASRRYTAILVIVAAAVIGYVLSVPLPTEHPNALEQPLPGPIETDSVAGNSAMYSHLGKDGETKAAHEQWDENEKGATHEISALATSGRLPYITRGSTKQEVLAIQGRPLRETDTAWDYGLSRINFQNGKVVDWYENPMNPLIVQR